MNHKLYGWPLLAACLCTLRMIYWRNFVWCVEFLLPPFSGHNAIFSAIKHLLLWNCEMFPLRKNDLYIFHRNIKLYRESTKQEELGKTWDNGIQRNVYDNIKKCPNTKKHRKQSQNGYSTSSAVHEKYCTKKSTVSDDSWLGFCVMLLFYAFYRGFYKILDFPIFESYMLINNFVEYNERYPFNDVITGRKLITRSVAKGENIWLHHEIIS